MASVAPALRPPQSAAESAQESPEGNEAKQKDEEAAGATHPAGHAQVADPASALKEPAGQGVQAEAPAALKVPAPQVAHVAAEEAPSVALALPAAQEMQASRAVEL